MDVPRFPRVVIPQCPHHVTQRGNARRNVFFSEADRRVYLGLLKQYTQLYGADILGFCLMTNHFHLVLRPTRDSSLAKVLREVNMRYAQYRNAIERSTGHLWQSRYYSCPVDPAYLGTVMRYVELNPVRAGLVREPAAYPWSSALAHVTLDPVDRDPDGMLALEDWLKSWNAEEWAESLSRGLDDAGAIREATYSGRPLGSPEFVARLETFLDRPLKRGLPGRPRKSKQSLTSPAVL